MKTEFGKWLMDIAKYMVTPIILGYGLYWVNEGEKEEKVKNKRK